MGGHALKTVDTIRIDKDDYKIIERYILEKYFNQDIFVIRYSKDKKDFGDLDLIVKYNGTDPKKLL